MISGNLNANNLRTNIRTDRNNRPVRSSTNDSSQFFSSISSDLPDELLSFKGKVVSKQAEKQLVTLYLLTVGEEAVNRCKIYELDNDSKKATGIEYFLEYRTRHFKGWLDHHQITIEGYDEKLQKPARAISFKLENLINIIEELGINIDEYQLDPRSMDIKIHSGFGIPEFIKLKTSDEFMLKRIGLNLNLRFSSSPSTAWMILDQHKEGNIKLEIMDKICYEGAAFYDRNVVKELYKGNYRNAIIAWLLLIAIISTFVYYLSK